MAACASAPAPSTDAQRERAEAAYNEIDANTGMTPAETRMVQPQNTIDYTDILRPVLMALPAAGPNESSPMDQVKNNPFAKAAMEGINEYLTEKGYEVRSLEGSEDLSSIIQMQGDISGNGDDLSYAAGLALGADVYIKFSGAIKNNMVTVEVSAYEVSTARLLGTKTGSVEDHGTSRENMRYLVHSAAKKALPALERSIHSYWSADWKKGTQYKVVMRIGERFSGTTLEDLQDKGISGLRSKFSAVKVNSMTEKTMDLVIYAHPTEFPDAYAVYSAIRESMSGLAQAKKNNIVNKLIILELN